VNGQLGWSYLILGLFSFVSNGIAVKFGKRPVFLTANILVFATTLWAANAKTWNMLLATQLIGSLALAPYDTLVSATVSDLYTFS
jgi:MFS family permease